MANETALVYLLTLRSSSDDKVADYNCSIDFHLKKIVFLEYSFSMPGYSRFPELVFSINIGSGDS